MKKSLLETNPYLKDPEQRKRLLRRSLVSSFAVEGIHVEFDEATGQFTQRKHDKSKALTFLV